MAQYNPTEIEEMKEGRKKAKKQRPPKRKYHYINDQDLIREFKIYELHTNKKKENWIRDKRQRRLIELQSMQNISALSKKKFEN